MTKPTTPLRQRMIEDMTLRNMSPLTQAAYVRSVANFAAHYRTSPDKLTFEDVRNYQVHLVSRGLKTATIIPIMCAIRFLYGRTLGKKDFAEQIPLARKEDKLPTVLSRDEVMRFLKAITDLRMRTIFITIYAAGLRISEPEKQLGLRALPTATLELERVELPAEARLGGDAGCDVRRLLNHSRAGLAAVITGLSRAVIEYAIPYAKEREAFDQAIAQKQGIAFKLAEMHIETESMRWLTWKAASQLEQGRDALKSSHHARAYAAAQGMWVADQGVQVLGGHGFIREHPVEMWYRNARTLGVLEGTVGL